ncbi:50S ribosomal protein L23 [bacterium]|nr:50S ribosomal protein L23 [bacterium]
MAKGNQKGKQSTPADYGVLLRPIITEKTAGMGEDGSIVAFEVAPQATKASIRTAVENIFEVEVLGIKTMNCRGKQKRRGAQAGMTRSRKKAYIHLGPGQAIDLVEGL